MVRQIIVLLFLVLNSASLFAQDRGVPMADAMRSNGKIYVVVAVIVTIFVGIVLYLVRLDRKLTKLEQQPPNA